MHLKNDVLQIQYALLNFRTHECIIIDLAFCIKPKYKNPVYYNAAGVLDIISLLLRTFSHQETHNILLNHIQQLNFGYHFYHTTHNKLYKNEHKHTRTRKQNFSKSFCISAFRTIVAGYCWVK